MLFGCRMSKLINYRIKVGKKATTFTLDEMMASAFAVNRGLDPDSDEAHKAIRKFAQELIDRAGDTDMVRVSHYIQKYIILDLMKPEAAERWWDWETKRLEENKQSGSE
jgi:hypothetical protein